MSRVNRTRGTLPRSAGTSSCVGHHVTSRMRSPRHHVLPGAYSTGFPHGSPARAPTVEKDSTALRAPLEYHSMPLDCRHPSEALRANEDIHQCVPHRTQQHISSIPLTDSDFPHRTFRRFCQHWSPSSDYPLAQSGPSTAEPGPIRAWEARQPRSTTIAAFLVQHRRTQLLSSYG